jgi:hypothetical protein
LPNWIFISDPRLVELLNDTNVFPLRSEQDLGISPEELEEEEGEEEEEEEEEGEAGEEGEEEEGETAAAAAAAAEEEGWVFCSRSAVLECKNLKQVRQMKQGDSTQSSSSIATNRAGSRSHTLHLGELMRDRKLVMG